jgi:S1-C subfamily serine protease
VAVPLHIAELGIQFGSDASGLAKIESVTTGGAGVVVLTPRRRPGSSGSKRQGGFPDVFQHNATVSPSDCGGPLIGLDGRALGINIASTSGPASYGLPAHLIAAEVDE